MKPFLNLSMLLVISAFIHGVSSQSDPCTDYQPIPDIHRRDAVYELSDGEDPINDRELVEGWYGFMTYKILDEAPGSFKCGGLYPMWIKNSDGQTATICVQDLSNECSREFGIDMRTCDGLQVYLLPEAPIHRASYCFVNNPDEPPMFNVTPSISVDLEDEERQSKLLFHCNFPRSTEDLFYKTIWYVEGAPVHTFPPAQWTEDYITDTTLTEDILMDKGFKAGINIQCAVRAQYNLDGAFSESGLSDNKFVGVKVHNWYNNDLVEGETRELYLQLTVPFGCGTILQSRNRCQFNVEFLTVSNSEDCASAVVAQSSCGIEPIKSEKWYQPSPLTLVGKVTSMYGETTGTTHMKLTTPKDIGELTEFWWDYDIGHVAVNVYKNTSAIMYKECGITNDPYLDTFDYWSFWTNGDRHVVDVGVFVLYQDETRHIEVQVETEICNPEVWDKANPICTCGVAVRAGRSVFEISHCDTPHWHIGYTACEDGGDVIIVRRYWDYYWITLPTGTIVRVIVHVLEAEYVDVYISPTPLDEGKKRGLCGVLSDNSEDDMVMRNGQISSNFEDFLESWRITKLESLFNPNVIEKGFSSFKPVYQYCTCDESTPDKQITCSAMAASEVCINPAGMDQVEPRDCVVAKRKKRMITSTNRRFKRATTEISWSNGWNISAATAYCESKFAESASVQLVKDVPGVDLAGPLSDCVADIKASGTTLFTDAAISSVGIKARREALVNPILSEPNPDSPSAPTLYDVIMHDMCPGDCRRRGTCSGGKCQCDPGYEGGDCSVDVTKPPQLVHVADDGYCDLQAKDCLQTEVVGDVFGGGKDSKCLIERQVVLPSGERAANKISSPNSIFESISEVFCALPELSEDDVVVSVNISVSHAGDIYSNELSVLVYDSSCVNVDHSTGTWTLQAGFCVYKGRCTPVGSLRIDTPCVRCVEEEGEDPVWKRLTENGCTDGHLHIGESTGSVMSSVSLRATSLLMLYHALLQIF